MTASSRSSTSGTIQSCTTEVDLGRMAEHEEPSCGSNKLVTGVHMEVGWMTEHML